MIKVVDNKNCTKKLVKGKVYKDINTLTISPKEILLLKKEDNLMVNKYVLGADRLEFPHSGNMYADQYSYKEIFEKDTLYITYGGHNDFSMYSEYYTDIGDKTLCLRKSLVPENNSCEEENYVFSRYELCELFNPLNYDSMHMLDLSGNITYSYTKKDGRIIGDAIIPVVNKKDNNNYNNVLITSNNNEFNISLYKIMDRGNGLYDIDISSIDINKLTKDYILELAKEKNYYINVTKGVDKEKTYKKAI